MLNISSFKGGLNTALDPRDIQNSELSNANNVTFDTNGIIKPIGRNDTGLSDILDFPHNNPFTADVRGGRNLFYFESNFQSGEITAQGNESTTWAASSPYLLSEKFSHTVFDDAEGAIDETGSQHWYLFGTDFPDAGDPGVHAIQAGNVEWNERTIMPYDNVGEGKTLHCVFHYNNNAVRVNNSFNNFACRSRWFGFIRKKGLFDVANSPSSDYHFNGWYELDNDIKKPTDIHFVSGTGTSTDANTPAGIGFLVKITATTGGGMDFSEEMTGSDLIYDLAISFIYDGIQESLLYEEGGKTVLESDGDDVAATDNALSIKVAVKTGFNPRITGGRVYYKIADSSDDYVLLCEVDFEKGIKASIDNPSTTDTPWTALADSGAPEARMESNEVKLTSKNLDTYSSLTEWGASETRVSIGCTGNTDASGNYPNNGDHGYGETYEASAISNGRCFIANTRLYKSERMDSAVPDSNYRGYSIEPNRIYYSGACSKNGTIFEPAYDCFPRSNFIDIETEDSSGFTALFGFADRLFAFKKDILIIINIAGDPNKNEWFPESEHQGLGINYPAQFSQFDEGAVWANSTGVYVYTGNDIKTSSSEDVDFKVGIQNIWYDRLGAIQTVTNNMLSAPLVGFSRHDKSIVVHSDMNDSNASTWVYNFKTDTWTKCNTLTRIHPISGDSVTEPSRAISNFITDSNGRLSFAKENDGLSVVTQKMDNHHFPANSFLEDGDHSWDNGDGTIDGWSNTYPIELSKVVADDGELGVLKYFNPESEPYGQENKTNIHYGPFDMTNGQMIMLDGILFALRSATREITMSFVQSTPPEDATEEEQHHTQVIVSDMDTFGMESPWNFTYGNEIFESATGPYWFRISCTWLYEQGAHEVFLFGDKWHPGLHQLDVSSSSQRVSFMSMDVNNSILDLGTPRVKFLYESQYIITKDFDFEQPGLKKRIYNLFFTYSSTGYHASPISYALDGSNNFVSMTGDFDNTYGDWKAGRFKPSSALTCQSIKFRVENKVIDQGFKLNDMSIEYRITSRRIV